MKSEDSKASFEDSQNAYREAYEAVITPHLKDEDSGVARVLKANEEWILSDCSYPIHFPPRSYSVPFGKQLLPLALPLDYKPTSSKDLSHNFLQMYLYGEDENISSLALRAGVSRQCMKQNLGYQAEKLLRNVPHIAKKHPSGIRFSKDSRVYLKWLKDEIDSGRSYDDLLASGISPFRLHQARINFNKRQRGLSPEYRMIY